MSLYHWKNIRKLYDFQIQEEHDASWALIKINQIMSSRCNDMPIFHHKSDCTLRIFHTEKGAQAQAYMVARLFGAYLYLTKRITHALVFHLYGELPK